MEKIRIIDRLLVFIDHLISIKEVENVSHFERRCGFYYGYIPNQKRGKGVLDGEAMEKITAIFPYLNLNWLITGNGDMLFDPKADQKKQLDFYKKAYESSEKQIRDLTKITNELKTVTEDLKKQNKVDHYKSLYESAMNQINILSKLIEENKGGK